VATQPNDMASIENSLPMEGRAILTEEISKGVRKDDNVTTQKVILFVKRFSISAASSQSYIIKIRYLIGLHPIFIIIRIGHWAESVDKGDYWFVDQWCLW
jgi:hypothetical protein